MALAVGSIENGKRKACANFLWLTTLLATAFLVVKGFEYAEDIHQQLVPTWFMARPALSASDMFLYLFLGLNDYLSRGWGS